MKVTLRSVPGLFLEGMVMGYQVLLSGEEHIGYLIKEVDGEGSFVCSKPEYVPGETEVDTLNYLPTEEFGVFYLVSLYCEENKIPKPNIDVDILYEELSLNVGN
jgi:hypothetical protein